MLNNFFNDKSKEEVKEPLFEIKPDKEESRPNPFAEIVSKDEKITTPVEVVVPPKPKVKIVEKLSGAKYNPVNILDLNNITQTYNDGKVTIFNDLNLSVKDIVDKGQFITILGQSGCGKCFTKDSIITIRNKKTKKIEKIDAFELIKRLRQPI